MAGWNITFSRPDGKIYPITQTTDGSGKTTFSNLIPGVYSVKETVQPGWKALSPNPQQVVIQDCEDARVIFENLEVVGDLQIKGRKLFQAWEKPYAGQTVGLSGWTITATLKGTDPEVYVTTTTDAMGNYIFDAPPWIQPLQIPGATITVCEEKRSHWIPVTPTCVDVHFPYPVPVDYTGAVVNFTNMQDPPPGAAPSRLRLALAVVRPTRSTAATRCPASLPSTARPPTSWLSQWYRQPELRPGWPGALRPVTQEDYHPVGSSTSGQTDLVR